PDAPLRGDQGDLRLHGGARLEPLPERPRGRERPVRDELGVRHVSAHGRQARLLQVHGQIDRREALPARHLHAQALPQPHRQRLPRARVTVVESHRPEPVRGRIGRDGPVEGGLPLHRRADALGRCARRHHQPHGQLLQTHQRAAHDVRCHLVAQHGNLRRQQPHAHDPHTRGRALRAAARRRRHQPLPVPGRPADGGPRRPRRQARSRRAARHRHVRGRPHREGCQAAAAQPARCAARARPIAGAEEGVGRGRHRLLHQAAHGRVERVHIPVDRLGAADHAGLLTLQPGAGGPFSPWGEGGPKGRMRGPSSRALEVAPHQLGLVLPRCENALSMRYSILSLIAQALQGNTGWKPVWRDAELKPAYDVVIVGGGGHGLATAYYLAKEHGITNVAVLEKGWLGGGNVGRNTTIIRSNYLLPGNTPFYEWSMKLWEGLEQDINYNAMVSQRGVLNLYHSDAQRDAYARRGNAMRLCGVDAELIDAEGVRRLAPYLDFANARFPIQGGLLQRRGGTVRHDAVAWGYARAASERGVDLVQNCEVTGIRVEGGRIVGVDTVKGFVRARKVGLACAGNSSRVAALAGLRLPIESHVLQAFVSEGVKPLVDQVITFGAGHFYISQ